MNEQSDAERLKEIASVDRPPFFLTLTRDEYDFLIWLASRAVEAEEDAAELASHIQELGELRDLDGDA